MNNQQPKITARYKFDPNIVFFDKTKVRFYSDVTEPNLFPDAYEVLVLHSHHVSELARLEGIIDDMNKNCISRLLHESRMNAVEAEIDKLHLFIGGSKNIEAEIQHLKEYYSEVEEKSSELKADRDRWKSCAVKLAEGLRFNVSKHNEWIDKGHWCDSKRILQSVVDSSKAALKHFDGMEK